MLIIEIPLKAKNIDCPKGYRLPGLNQYTNANRNNRYSGGKLKKDTEQYITWFIPLQFRGWNLSGVEIFITWYEFDKRRDFDNIVSAKKFILDALVKSGVLAGDGQKHVHKITDEVKIDAKNPRIIIEIIQPAVKELDTI